MIVYQWIMLNLNEIFKNINKIVNKKNIICYIKNKGLTLLMHYTTNGVYLDGELVLIF